MSSPDHNTPETTENAPEPPAALARRLRERAANGFRDLRAAVTGTGPEGGPHRLPPRLRTAQIGAAAVATGVLGVVLGAPTPAPDAHAETRAAGAVAGHARSGPVPPPSTGTGPGGAQAVQVSDPRGHPPAPQAAAPEATRAPEAPAAPAPVPAGDPVDQWIAQATAVLEQHGVPRDQVDPEALRTIIEHESGGNPGAANNWDSNAAAGTPSKGLMQTIEPTFHSYAVPGHQDIWNPVDNIVAGTRYSIDRYGSVSNVPGVVGVESGSSYQGY